MMRVGIYGGTFSPPHKGHVAAAKAFMDFLRLDILYVIPTADPPHKTASASAEDRLEMTRLAFENVDGVIVSDIEIVRGGKSYTVDTLRTFARPDVKLFLLMGTDMMLSLDRWKDPEEIFRLCYPFYIRREFDLGTDDQILKKQVFFQKKFGTVVRRIPAEPVPMSSDEVRKKIVQGEDVSAYLCKKVEDYISAHGLYGGEL